MAKVIIFPSNTPTPPCPTFSFILRVLRRIIAVWKARMSNDYPALPAVIPTWWTVERVLHFANSGKHTPVFVATATHVSRVRVVGEWAA